MSITKILEISRITPTPEQLWGYAIDIPTAGYTSENYYFELKGWIVGKHAPALKILVMDKLGQLVGRASLNVERPDVAEHYNHVPHATLSGFSGAVYVPGLFLTDELVVKARIFNKTLVPIANLRIQHQPLQPGYHSRFQPLIINSIGRTGTTWLMRLLSEHERIITHRVYPYESRIASYWLNNLLKIHDLHPNHPNPLFEINRQWIEAQLCHNPALAQWFRHDYIEQLGTFCQQSIDNCYIQIAQQNGYALDKLFSSADNTKLPVYFIEKIGPGYLPVLLRELYTGMREIILVRDFRDMFCSIRSFTQKKNLQDFGRGKGENEDSFIDYTLTQVVNLFEVWQRQKDKVYLLHYEDLILNPEKTLIDLLNYLQLNNSAETIRQMLSKAKQDSVSMQEHRTSVDIQSSIGRWKKELNAHQKTLIHERFGKYLEAFGYEL